jgi:hypothetical protein
MMLALVQQHQVRLLWLALLHPERPLHPRVPSAQFLLPW